MAYKKIPPINWDKLDGMLLYEPSLNVCADEMNVSHDTLERKIKEKYKMKFAEYRQTKVDKTAYRLKQKIINKALDGDNTCLIFSLKNVAGWCDKVENGFDKDKQQILLKYSLDKISTDDGTNGSGAA